MVRKATLIPAQNVEQLVFLIRGQKIMLSTHLADLYDVEPKVMMQAVKRNISRFPKDFMFQISGEELENLKSQIVTSSWGVCEGPGHMHWPCRFRNSRSSVWGRATVIDSKNTGKLQKAAINGVYNRFFDPEIGLMEPGPSGQEWT